MRCLLLLLALPILAAGPPSAKVKLPALRDPVEILRDRWGVPHIYARNTHDLFFAQGWITAKDRLFQIDLWRRIGTGHLAEILGLAAVPRDRIARLVRYRGDWEKEWKSYSPDAKEIATAFTAGINAYIDSLHGVRTREFAIAGYDPDKWAPEDVTARVAGLLMTRNAASEVQRAMDVDQFGVETVEKLMPPDPFVSLLPPKGLDLKTITKEILRDYTAAIGNVRFPGEQGSNNWVIDGTMSVTGKPILANDPHRPIQLPSLRKTVHLVAPGWNVIGAGEPALPGVALGHNESIAFGFTIVGIDQQDLYVETLNPENPNQYLYKGKWLDVVTEREQINVKASMPRAVELRYTQHGPILYEDRERHLAYALRWVGEGPGGAGYLPALSLIRAKNWQEFRERMAGYKVPSENMVYADTKGNIGWIAAGLAPIRKGWNGLFPVPGDSGEYEWTGFLGIDDHPQAFNPARHFIATANHKILPDGYSKELSYEWAAPYRAHRVEEMLQTGGKKFTIDDLARMQQDVTSLPAREFQRVLKAWTPASASGRAAREKLLEWDTRVTAESEAATLFALWIHYLPGAELGKEWGSRPIPFETLLARATPESLDKALTAAQQDPRFGKAWGVVHQLVLKHPLNRKEFDLAAVARPGDANTVNAASGQNLSQTNGPSYRQVIDLADWDRSVMTNVPGESGDPDSKHYSDLLDDWNNGRYHPMPFSRKAVEAAAEERILLEP